MACDIQKIPLGSKCAELPGLIVAMITTPDDYEFTKTQLDSFLTDPTAANTLFLNDWDKLAVWPYFDTFENISEEAVYEETPMSYLNVRDGNYRFRFGIAQGLCTHKAMFTHRAKSGRVILIDNNGYAIFTKANNGNYRGLSVQLLHTEKLIFSDGSVATKSPIVLALRNSLELDQYGFMVKADWFYTIPRIYDVTLTLSVNEDEDEFTVTAKLTCDNTPVLNLVQTDFIVTGFTPTGFTELGNGQYRFAAASAVSDASFELKKPNATNKPFVSFNVVSYP